MIGKGLRTVQELGGAKPHGTRLRYLAGCKCLKCRMANSNYETARARARKAGDWNGITDAAPARRHINKLGRAGVGYKMVAAAASLPTSIVFGIKSGSRPRARARTIRSILTVTRAALGDKALVSAASTWRRIRSLQEQGYSKAQLARELGRKSRALQIHPTRCTARTRHQIEVLYKRLMT